MTEGDQAKLPSAKPDTLDLETLEKHLWAAADKLRGSIGSADYKNYIFGLLFLKRANDRFEEEVAEELGIPEETAREDRDLHSLNSAESPTSSQRSTSKFNRQTKSSIQ